MSTESDIAVLQANYLHLTGRVEEVRDEMRAGMLTVNAKLDTVITQMSVQKATSTMRARAMGFLSHGATGVVTLVAAKFLHIPLNLG